MSDPAAAYLRRAGVVETVGDILNPDEAFRARHVGASEVAALFDASPWLTRYELWHRKAGTIATPDFGGNERIEWGIRLERPVIEAARDRWGYRLLGTPEALSNGKGLGGHADELVAIDDRDGTGVIEVKTADWLVAKKWGDEPPLNYLLQAQTYMGLVGATWGDLIVLVGGNRLERYRYDFRPALFAEIERRTVEFWQSVRANDQPVPDFTRDGDTLAAVLGSPDDTLADLQADNRATELADEWLAARERRKDADDAMERAKTELLLKIGSAGSALTALHRIAANQTSGSAGTLITAEHVGTTIGARRGYRRFEIKERK